MSYRTEQEQIEIFRKWWSEFGTTIVIATAVFLATFSGWSWWQKHRNQHIEQASTIYQDLLDASRQGAADATGGKNPAELAGRLRKDYADTFYGNAAALFLARDAVKRGDLDAAEQQLEEVLQHSPDDAMKYTALYRSAQVLYAKGKYPEALDRLKDPLPESLKPVFLELRGDVLAASGKPEEAKTAYQDAAAAAEKTKTGARDGLLEMKMNDLAKPEAVK